MDQIYENFVIFTESDQIEKRRGGRRKMETLPSEEKRREESQNEADSEEHKRN